MAIASGVGVRQRLEDARELAVVLADDARRELGHDHLADPVVDHLDGLGAVADPGAHEAPRSHEADHVVDRVANARGVRGDRDGQRTARHRHDPQEPQLALRQPREARLHHLLEGDGGDPGRRVLGAGDAVRSGDAARELVDQERAPARLQGDGVGGRPARARRRPRAGSAPGGASPPRRADRW